MAEGIAAIWWLMTAGAGLLLALVMTLVFYAMFRDPARRLRLAAVPFLAVMGVGLPLVVLTALLIHGTALGRRITESVGQPLHIEVTAHRWWWEVRYSPDDGPEVITANELRLPVDVPVELSVRSADVIHSFWIPNLGGKIDMIPGLTNTLRLRAAVPGRFRAQCSEFCGPQHARMGFLAIAEPAEAFAQWRRERAAAAAAGPGTGFGRFMELGCGNCHSVPGHDAPRGLAPVLTAMGDRPTVGAGAAPLSPATLRAWLADHGARLKPASAGPPERALRAQDVELLAAFLEQRQ